MVTVSGPLSSDCDGIVHLTEGDLVSTRCGSFIADVSVGPVEIILGETQNIMVTVSDDTMVSATGNAEGQINIANTPDSLGPVTVEVDGVVFEIDPGGTSAANSCGTLAVQVDLHTIGGGAHPGSTKEGIAGVEVRVFDKSEGSCARHFGVSWQHYPDIFSTCDPIAGGVTALDGSVRIPLEAGDYIVIGEFDPDPLVENDELHIGVSAGDFQCAPGDDASVVTMQKYLQVIVKANGKTVPGKYTRLTGSELLLIEPEYVLWDEIDQLYPFVFQSIGDWGVMIAVEPREGFVADYEQLSEDVDNEVEAVQFTITEVGSDLVPTVTTFDVTHHGRSRQIHSCVGIMLTPAYAKQRGFDVGMLRGRGLIMDPPGNPGQGRRPGERGHGAVQHGGPASE